MNTFAAYIEKIKDSVDLSDRELAEIMGVSHAGFDNFTNGYVPPSQRAVSRLIAALALLPAEGAVMAADKLPFEAAELPSAMDGLVIEIKDGNMAGQGLTPGASALVRPCRTPKDGDILLLAADGGERFAQFRCDGDRVCLSDGLNEAVMSRESFAGRVRVLGRLVRLKTDF